MGVPRWFVLAAAVWCRGASGEDGADDDGVFLTVVNGLEAGAAVDVFYLGREARGVWHSTGGGAPHLDADAMVCVAADFRSGYTFELPVGRRGDAFLFSRRDAAAAANRGDVRARPDLAGRAVWRHDLDGGATVFLRAEGDGDAVAAVGVRAEAVDAFARLAWGDGVGSLFEDADASLAAGDADGARAAFARAARSLDDAALLGDATAGTVRHLAVLAGVLPAAGADASAVATTFGLETLAAPAAAAADAAVAGVRRNAQSGRRRGATRSCSTSLQHVLGRPYAEVLRTSLGDSRVQHVGL